MRTYHLSKQVVRTILVFHGEDPPSTARWRLKSNRNSMTLPWCDNGVRCNGRLRPGEGRKQTSKMEDGSDFQDVMTQNCWMSIFLGIG